VRPGLPRHREELERILGLGADPEHRKEVQEREGAGAFGAWLSKTRIARNMSVPELAHNAGISAVAIYNLEQGKSLNPQKKTRVKLEKALGEKTPMEVIEQEEEEQEIEGIGALMSFDPLSKQDRPAVPGVYVLYDISDRPIYVGKANNISRRVNEHEIAFWFKSPIVEKGAYIHIKDERLRHQVEQILIKFLKSNAVLNKQSVERVDESD
jgi:transcriptional regulator with XRE-family HTH domain